MLDPIHIPVLLKAIDFIFDEGRKILEERRERRKTSEANTASPAAEPSPAPEPADIQETNQVQRLVRAVRCQHFLEHV